MNFSSIFLRFSRKFARISVQGRLKVRKGLAKAYFGLPWQTGSNPRKRIRSIPECCQRVETLGLLMEVKTGHDEFALVQHHESYQRILPSGMAPGAQDRFSEGIDQYQGGCTFQAPDVLLARMHRALVYSKDALVMNRHRDILWESALSKTEVLEKNGILDQLTKPRALPVAGTYALLSHPWAFGYYHWLLEILPRLAYLEPVMKHSANLRLIVPHPLNRFQRESLILSGIAAESLVPFDGKCWEVEELYFASMPAPTGNPSPRAVEWLRQAFLPPAPNPTLPTGHSGRKLYLSRRDAPQRRLLNEAEISCFLQEQGFEILCAGEYSFEQQVAIFSEAACVIAPHGAAVSNMAFAPRQTPLIELFGENYLNGCYWALANILDQPYGCVIGQCTGLDYEVSLNELKQVMLQLGL